MNGVHSLPQRHSRNILSSTLTQHLIQPAISIFLTQHIVMETDTVLTTANKSHSDAYVYIHHSTISIKVTHLMMLKEGIYPTKHHHLSHRVIYHHLLISSRSPLISRDMSLSITLDNTIHILISKGPDA